MDAVAATEAWVRDFVIALDLCPFAAGPLGRGAVRVVASRGADVAELLAELLDEVEVLLEGVAETTLLVVPQLGLGFEDLLDISELAEDLLEQQGLGGEIQLVAFHPDYVFADGDGPDDPANATNRSPFPTLHLLVAAEVEAVIQDHPDIASIPTRNVALLRRLAEESDAP